MKNPGMRAAMAAAMLAAGSAFVGAANGAVAPAAPAASSAAQVAKLKKQVGKLANELRQVNKKLAAMQHSLKHLGTRPATGPATAPAAAPAASNAAAAAAKAKRARRRARRRLRAIKRQVAAATAAAMGATETGSRMLIVGDGAVGYSVIRGPGHPPASFNANLSPLLLWQLDHNFLVVGALSLNYGPGDSTSVTNGQAYIDYRVGHNLSVGAGVFPVPFGQYHNHFDPPWVTPLPDDPLFSGTTLDPGNGLGVFAEGAVQLGKTGASELVYNVYAVNGPSLFTSDGNAGQLDFANYNDTNNDKAVGGRIGYLPFPQLEVGYSAQYGKVSPDGYTNNVDALLQAVDLNYYDESKKIGGLFRARSEWYFQNVGSNTYDANGAAGFGPLTYSNASNGGYIQLSYQPLFSGNKYIDNLEGVFRWDYLDINLPSSQGGAIEQRYTVGLDYWINWRTVLKGAYEFDNKDRASGNDAFLLQLGFEI